MYQAYKLILYPLNNHPSEKYHFYFKDGGSYIATVTGAESKSLPDFFPFFLFSKINFILLNKGDLHTLFLKIFFYCYFPNTIFFSTVLLSF